MARQPRFDIAGIPQPIVQRGNDRQPCFADEDDYLRYLQELGEAATRHACAVHAYVLMTNHVHLLAQQQRVWASEKFRKEIEALAHRAAGIRPRGRPRSAAADNDQSSADGVPCK